MRPSFLPELVNGPFGDPGLYVDMMFEHRALLFDLGDIAALEPRKLLRISDVFVTHTHMDHFIGFDRLLRLNLGRDRAVTLYGPPGFIGQVQHKLAAFTWDLVASYPSDFTVRVRELGQDGALHRATFHCRDQFTRHDDDPMPITDSVLLDEPLFRIRCAALDHHTLCLGYALEEKAHANVWKNRLAEFGVEPGPWLRDLKHAALSGAADDTIVVARWRSGNQPLEKRLQLGRLKERVLQVVQGLKIAYVTDVAAHADNARHINDLVGDADLLFIEATFLRADAEVAGRKHHLTAWSAGQIGRRARVRRIVPFHFSPRYAGREAQLRAEVEAAFNAADG